MDFDSIAQSIWNQFVTAWNAPVPFIAALLIVGYVIIKLANWQHSVRIANLNSQLDLYREANAVSSANAARAGPAVLEREAEAGALLPPAEENGDPARDEPDKPEERVFVDDGVTPETLRGLFGRGPSTLASQIEAGPHIGKWMRLSGPISNVSDGLGVVLVTMKPEGAPTIPFVNLSFSTSDRERLAALGAGDEINAVGKLHSVDPLSIFFIDCELT